MGTVSEKLVYLNGTKQAIKQAINEDFEVIDNNTTFREYAEEISSNNAKYKDLIPKETKNATNTLDISNSAGLDKALVTQYGNTYQEGEPTPDTPQEIQVVTGDNSIIIEGKNKFNIDDAYYKRLNTGTVTINNNNIILENVSTTTHQFVWWNIPIMVGEEITISYNSLTESTSDNNNGVFYTFNDEPYTSFVSFDSFSKVDKTNKYSTTTATKKYLVIGLRSVSSCTNTLNKLQIEKGPTATTYEPYQSQTYEVDLPVENLFDKDNANVLNGNLVSSSSITSSVSNRIFYINCQPNTTYTVQKAVGNYFVLGTTSSTPTIGGSYSQKTMDNTATKISITTDANAKYLICWYWNNGDTLTEEQTKATIQVELGTKANKYQPYGTTPIELCKIGDYKDRIYPLNGKWYLEKKIGKFVFNGSENWSLYLKTFLLNILGIGTPNSICSSFSDQGTYWTSSDENNRGKYTMTNTANQFKCMPLTDMTLEEFKTWLSTNNVIVYYVLATPTTTEITENNYPTLYNQLNNIKLFEGVNHITMTNESGLDVEFDIEYYKDWKLD